MVIVVHLSAILFGMHLYCQSWNGKMHGMQMHGMAFRSFSMVLCKDPIDLLLTCLS